MKLGCHKGAQSTRGLPGVATRMGNKRVLWHPRADSSYAGGATVRPRSWAPSKMVFATIFEWVQTR